jgi:uncharacterized protein (DUF2249 family)
LTHIKGVGTALRNLCAMPSIADLVTEALATARAGQWPVHRLHFAALHDALSEDLAPGEEDLRIRLDTLNSAAPEPDPAGYLAELEQLAELLRARGLPQREVAARFTTLDLRGLQPPEPIARIFEALERAPGEPLRAILPHEPVPLYSLLRERGFTCRGAVRADGGYEVLVERG